MLPDLCFSKILNRFSFQSYKGYAKKQFLSPSSLSVKLQTSLKNFFHCSFLQN